jgi:hypothetical protein
MKVSFSSCSLCTCASNNCSHTHTLTRTHARITPAREAPVQQNTHHVNQAPAQHRSSVHRYSLLQAAAAQLVWRPQESDRFHPRMIIFIARQRIHSNASDSSSQGDDLDDRQSHLAGESDHRGTLLSQEHVSYDYMSILVGTCFEFGMECAPYLQLKQGRCNVIFHISYLQAVR